MLAMEGLGVLKRRHLWGGPNYPPRLLPGLVPRRYACLSPAVATVAVAAATASITVAAASIISTTQPSTIASATGASSHSVSHAGAF